MRTYFQTVADLSTKELARVLAEADPSDFAEFWFEFNKLVENDKVKLDKLAQVMADSLGGNRKICFRRLHSLILFHEERNARHPSMDAEPEDEA